MNPLADRVLAGPHASSQRLADDRHIAGALVVRIEKASARLDRNVEDAEIVGAANLDRKDRVVLPVLWRLFRSVESPDENVGAIERRNDDRRRECDAGHASPCLDEALAEAVQSPLVELTGSVVVLAGRKARRHHGHSLRSVTQGNALQLQQAAREKPRARYH